MRAREALARWKSEAAPAPASPEATAPVPAPSRRLPVFDSLCARLDTYLDKPRRRYLLALLVQGLLSPFSLTLLGGTLLAGLIFGVLPIAVPVGLLIYLAAAAVVVLDDDVRRLVLERERARRPGLRAGGDRDRLLQPAGPPPRIAALLERAAEKQSRIDHAIERAELPYDEVSEEVERLIETMRQIAARAELLEEGLRDAPAAKIADRLKQLETGKDPGKEALIEALQAQLAVQRRLEAQLERFYVQMEQILVEFDTIRGQLVSLSASTEASNQRRLAARVQSLREDAGSVAAGMEAAYADRSAPIDLEQR